MLFVPRMLPAKRSGWHTIAFTVVAMMIAAAWARGQIESLTLGQIVDRSDNTVYGEIVDRFVFREDHPEDGPELYFTVLTIEGRSLVNGNPIFVEVTYHGGFVDEENGVYNSEAPSADETRVGKRVLVFYKWVDNMGGDVAGNALYAAHGGLYRTAETRAGTVVLGRGRGYAIRANRVLEDLASEVAALAKRERGRR